MDAFAFLLREPIRPSTVTSPRSCFALLASFDDACPSSMDRAAIGGFVADRLGYAFLAGYRAALARLDPTLTRASLCATEQGGGHPRAIATRLTGEGMPLRSTERRLGVAQQPASSAVKLLGRLSRVKLPSAA